MIDVNQILRFLTKDSVSISIEEFLFLSVVRIYSIEEAKPDSLTLEYIKLYYAQNVFYGRDLYKNEESKFNDWNLLIEKLVKQEYLLDYRKNKTLFNINELEVTDKFSNLIWKNDKMEVWNGFVELVENSVGLSFTIEGTTVSYFGISSVDKSSKIKNHSDMVDYFWKNICKNGNVYEIEKFYHHVEYYMDKYRSLNKKVINFLLDYHEGTLKREIERMMEND